MFSQMATISVGELRTINTSYGRYYVEFRNISRNGGGPENTNTLRIDRIPPLEVEFNETGKLDVHFNLIMRKEEIIPAVAILRDEGYGNREIASQLMGSEELWKCLMRDITQPFWDGILLNRLDGTAGMYSGNNLHSVFFYRNDLWESIELWGCLNIRI